jgi:hypothetical protein
MLFAVQGTDRASDLYVNALMLGGVSGLGAAAVIGWIIAKALGNPFKRAMVAMVAVGGAAFVAALTIVANALVGRIGLLALAALCILVLLLAYRALRAPAR